VKLKDIIKTVNAKVIGLNNNLSIDSISTDSRIIKKGELFIALDGKHFCGCEFISDAVKKGASAVITDNQRFVRKCTNAPLLIVKNARDALSAIAKAHRDAFCIPFICVVGSNGKTTTKDLIGHILKARFKVLKTDENCNNEIGIAKTLLKLRDHDIAVIEAGTDSPGEIACRSRIIRPDIVITTNIGMSHLQGLKTISGVLKEKIAMVKSLPKGGTWIKNLDDKALSVKSYKGIQTIGFAITNRSAQCKAENIKYTDSGIEFCVGEKVFSVPLLGRHNIYNSLAAIATASIFMEQELIRESLASFSSTPKRMQIYRYHKFKIINDTYNSNPDSLRSAVSALTKMGKRGRKFLVCADMLELGKRSSALHNACGRFIAKSGAIDKLILYGRYACDIGRGALDGGMKKTKIIEFKDKKNIVSFLKDQIAENDTVLVKGSRAMRMEKVVEAILPLATSLNKE